MNKLLIFGLLIFASFSEAQTIQTEVEDTVQILIDHWGVPHIYAKTEQDLFFAQGFNAARDRLFQFEIWRRQSTGTVAEILGPRELKRDIGTRLFMFRGNMEEELSHYHPKGIMIIKAFVSGVNAYINWVNNHPENLPPEFKLLNIKPQLWTPEVVISRHQGLLGNIEEELDIGRMIHLVGEEKVREVMWFHPFDPVLTMDKKVDGKHLLNDILALYKAYRKPVSFMSEDIGYEDEILPSDLDYRRSVLWEEKSNIGSNNWVVSGDRTQSGYPMMANDPHRTLAVPSLRYMAHLVGPGWNVIGGGEPEIPGISIGHNEYGAWGLTVFDTDAEDLYVYKLNPNNPDQYWFRDAWHDMKIIRESIPVKGGKNEEVELKYTLHGPVVFQDDEAHIAYSVKCGWLEPGGSPYLASLRMNQSFDFESFRDACNYSHIPGENMVWADRVGNIGWQAVGIAPIRNNFSGLVPLPGDGSYEWNDYLEIKKKPNAYNPASGMIVTANENLTPLDFPYPEAIGYQWTDPFRGDRIAEFFGKERKLTMMDMMLIQNDHLSIPARTLVPYLQRLSSKNPQVELARKKLLDWNFRMDVESTAASIYNAWETALKQALKEIKVPKEIWPYFGSLQIKKMIDFLTFPDGDFGKKPIAGRDSLLIDCLTDAVQDLQSRLGGDMEHWQYGQPKYKHVMLTHALGNIAGGNLRDQLNVGPLPRGGNGTTVGSTGSSLNQKTGATFKIISDTEDWDR
ncbi:MAG: penicillin acylase family protein, partial [Saprospiraceae bacterium]|nr:penicillin acylase family protein [Saprospiraceae bacterium]